MNTSIEIIEFTDPACTWCWGSEPVLRKLEYFFDHNLKISYSMGGLVKDAKTFMDQKNNIGGDLKLFNQQVAKHWLEASEQHGMPVETDDFELFTESDRSTFPMNIAYKAAQFQGEEIANCFLRRMREAIAAEARQANKTEVLIELANDVGLDIPLFVTSLNDGSAEQAFNLDRDSMNQYSIRGFPGYLVKNNEGKEVLMQGYQSYEDFIAVINSLLENRVSPVCYKVNKEHIINFISCYDRIAPVELQMVFDLDKNITQTWLNSLTNSGHLSVKKVGNGAFYSLSSQSGFCAYGAGMCNL